VHDLFAMKALMFNHKWDIFHIQMGIFDQQHYLFDMKALIFNHKRDIFHIQMGIFDHQHDMQSVELRPHCCEMQ
jgi:hypothetical protein